MSTCKYLFVLAVCASACQSAWHSDPEVTFYNSNVLLPHLEFTTPDSTVVRIEYWPVDRPSARQRTKPSHGRNHAITLFNVKPNRHYAYTIVHNNRSSKEFFFQTDSVPAHVLHIRKERIDTTVFDGFILLRRFFKHGADVLIDREGDIVWYHSYDTAVRRAFTWTSQNTILSIYDSARIMETDLMGNVILDLDLEQLGLPYKVHHEIFYDPAGNIVTITHDSARYDLRKFGGTKNQYLTADGILVLSKEGKVVWIWNLLQAEDPTRFTGAINLKENWGHANSIVLDGHRNYLISFRDFNQVWKVDGKQGDVLWKLGAGGNIVPEDPSDYFIRQHSIHFNPRNELMMFDNGDSKIRPNSRVMAYEIDESAKKATTMIRVELPRSLSSYRMGSAEMLSDDKFLVCTTRKDAIITVVNREGQILWKVATDHASYRAYLIKDPFKNFIE